MNKSHHDESTVRVTVDRLCFYYGRENILDEVSVVFAAGAVQYILGSSGAGKTTFAMLLAGALQPDSGSIVLLPDVMPRLVLQFPEQLFLTDSIAEEWALLSDLVSLNHAETAMQRFGLSLASLAPRSPRSLSFGQRRLLALALQSAHNSPFLILDEPTLGLDEDNLQKVLTWAKELRNQNKVCIIITHDQALLERCPGQAHILAEHKLKWSGSTADFLQRPDLHLIAGFA